MHNLSRVTSPFSIHTRSGLVGSDISSQSYAHSFSDPPPPCMHTHTLSQTCYASQGDSQVGAKGSSHVWEGVAPNRCTAITRLDPLHDPRPRATCSSLQKTYYQPAGSLSKPNDVAELTPWMNDSLQLPQIMFHVVSNTECFPTVLDKWLNLLSDHCALCAVCVCD